MALEGGRRARKWVMSCAIAGARARREGSYVGARTGLVECSDKPSSSALGHESVKVPDTSTHLYILQSTANHLTYSVSPNVPCTNAFAPSECSALTCALLVPVFSKVEIGSERSKSSGMSISSTSPKASSSSGCFESIETMADTETDEDGRVGAAALGVNEGVVLGDGYSEEARERVGVPLVS